MDSEADEKLSDVIAAICEVIIPQSFINALFTGQGEDRPAEMTLYRASLLSAPQNTSPATAMTSRFLSQGFVPASLQGRPGLICELTSTQTAAIPRQWL